MIDNSFILNEFAQSEDAIGVMLQEVTSAAAEPRIIEDTGGVVRFETILQDTQPNRNKRRYPADVLTQAITSARVQELIQMRSFYGEANHPFDPDMKRQMVIDATRISHLITDITPPTNSTPVRGIVETAATSCGRDMRGLIVENRSTVAFSMRGMGGVRRAPGQDYVEVTSPLALYAYDWVTFPSHKVAYMNTQSNKQEGARVITREQAISYARDKSGNIQTLVEQMELDVESFQLTEDFMDMLIHTKNGTTARVFLESAIRNEFRSSILKI